MAKAYTLTEKAAPTNPIASVASGGSLTANTTYYYKIFTGGYNNAYADENCWLSAPSAEITATTTTTAKRIYIHFDNNATGSELAGIYRTTTSGSYFPSNSTGTAVANLAKPIGFNYALYNGVVYTALNTRYTFTSTGVIASLVIGETITEQGSGATALVLSDPAGGSTFYISVKTGTWGGANNFDGSVTGANAGKWQSTSTANGYFLEDSASTSINPAPYFADGLPILKMTGGTLADPITPQNLYDYLVSAGKTYCIDVISVYPTGQWSTANSTDVCGIFNFKFNLIDASGNVFKIPGGVIVWQTVAKTMLLGTFIMGEIDPTYGFTSNGAVWAGLKSNGFYDCISYQDTAGSTIYGSSIGNIFAGATILAGHNHSAFQLQMTATLNAYDSVIRTNGRMINPFTIRNSRLMTGSSEVGGITNTSDVINGYFDTYCRTSYSLGTVTYNGMQFSKGTTSLTFDIMMYVAGNPLNGTQCIHANDCIFDIGTPVIRYYNGLAGYYWDAVYLQGYTTTFKVVDINGNPISGAIIQVVDKDGKKALFSKTSDTKSSSNQGKVGTSVYVSGTVPSLTVGKYYRQGDEVILVTAGSGTGPYTITRAQDGSTANFLGLNASKLAWFYERFDSLTTSASGAATAHLVGFKAKGYDLFPTGTAGGTINATVVAQSPFTITITKPGYETYTNQYTADAKRDLVIELKDAIDVVFTNHGPAIKVNKENSGNDRDVAIIP